MLRKIKELIQDLKNAGFGEISDGGKESHRKFTHKNYTGAVTLSGNIGEDAKIYQQDFRQSTGCRHTRENEYPVFSVG